MSPSFVYSYLIFIDANHGTCGGLVSAIRVAMPVVNGWGGMRALGMFAAGGTDAIVVSQ